MYYQIFKLEHYFTKTNIYFSFLDSIFTKQKDNKQTILEKLNISSSSYRTQRAKENTNKKNINKLLEYFGVLDVSLGDIKECEKLISKTYYYCYYKNFDKMRFQLELLNLEISKNNILLPVLILFRVFINMNLEHGVKELINIVEEDLDYLKTFFNKNYFRDELEFLYLIVLYNFNLGGDVINIKLDNLAIRYVSLSWLYHFVKGSNAYLKSQFDIALPNFVYVLDEFKITNNLERYFIVTNNIAYIYNIFGEYHLSYNFLQRVVEYVFGDNHQKYIKMIVMHLFYSLFMLERYDEIMLFFKNVVFEKQFLNPISTIICMMTARKLGYLNIFDELMKLNFESDTFKIVKEFYIKNNKSVLDKLKSKPYPMMIKRKILEK